DQLPELYPSPSPRCLPRCFVVCRVVSSRNANVSVFADKAAKRVAISESALRHLCRRLRLFCTLSAKRHNQAIALYAMRVFNTSSLDSEAYGKRRNQMIAPYALSFHSIHPSRLERILCNIFDRNPFDARGEFALCLYEVSDGQVRRGKRHKKP